MRSRGWVWFAVVAAAALAAVVVTPPFASALPPGNTVAQWNKIAEDTVVGSGAFQTEGLIYMSYTSAAVYDAVVAIEGRYRPYATRIRAPKGASVDCAVIEAAYRTLGYSFASFPSLLATLNTAYADSLAAQGGCTSDGGKGTAVGLASANAIIALRQGDGRMTPVGTTSPFPTLPPGPGVYRLTPPHAAPQTPWVSDVRPFILRSAEQFLPPPPPSLSSDEWVDAFEAIKVSGAATGSDRTDEETAVAKFWSANVIRQYERLLRDVAASRALDLLETARLAAMVNLVGADAQISVLHAKYHYLFWRPVTAIDPTSVKPTGDGFGPVPGYDDANAATTEMTGWRPLLVTPNHPEYPAAHGSLTSAMAEVMRTFLGTRRIDVDIYGFDAAGPTGNLNAVRHYATTGDLRHEIVNARFWAGLHYPFSGWAGVRLGRAVARYDLRHAFGCADERDRDGDRDR